MILLLSLSALVMAGVLYQALGAYRDTRRYPAPGRVIDIGSARLHLHEHGTGRPVVVLESGIAATSLSWALVESKVAAFTSVCSYDRAGLGWSGECALPRTVEQMVAELRALLSSAAIPPPYILVGHSFGGLIVRAYAHLHPDEVSGLLFVDPVSFEYWADCESEELRRLKLGVRLSRRGAWLARFGIVRLALSALVAGGRRFPKLIARATAKQQGTKLMEGLAGEVRKLPPEVWPMVRAHWSRPKCFRAMALYLESLPESARAVLRMPIPRHIPFIVLSASTATAAELAERDSWIEQSEHGRHIRLKDCDHWVQLERPDAVADAVRELVAAAPH